MSKECEHENAEPNEDEIGMCRRCAEWSSPMKCEDCGEKIPESYCCSSSIWIP